MHSAQFQFHDELNFFLPHRRRGVAFTHSFDWRASIKDRIESLGVPHAEVELLLANGHSVDFSYIVQDGDDIEVYPRFEAINLPGKVRLRPPFPGRPRFVLDTHLGRLVSYLRMMGFDTLYRNDYDDDELARISHGETRILLTRDMGVLKRNLVVYGYYVRNTDSRKRIVEVTRRFNLAAYVQPFRFCLKCNGLLETVDKAQIADHLSADTHRFYDEFRRCESCGQIFWKGSHYQRMQTFMAEVLAEV